VFAHRFELATPLADRVDEAVHLPAPPNRTEIGYLALGVVTIIVPFNWPLAILAASLPQAVLDPPDGSRVVPEEQFGPTLPILPFDDEDDAVARANDTWSGLCSSVWTEDLDHTAAVARRLRTGYTFVNAHSAAHLDERAPFGGFNHSGMGREMGLEGLREFMDTHAVGFPA
jgi:acyl-CoA reductase-like NAD-dependent aldehyde dehydrogenase